MPDLGPHLLGRKPNTPDERDWTPDRLHAHLALHAPTPVPPASTLDKTIRQAVTDRDPFVTTWKGLLALWKWIKSVLFPPKPGPTPPGPTPTVDGPLWDCNIVLDQGNYGTCVGNAWAGWGNSAPIMDSYSEADARAIYYESTCIGGACDATGQNGSSTRDGVKAMQQRGKLTAYAFATTMAEIDEWLDNHGPVVIGINWTDPMFNPDASGLIHYTGPVAGGHEVFIRQNVKSMGRKRLRNSWASSWGLGGDFFLSNADLQRLLDDGGDACLASEI
jgi:hypothetical protein